MKRVNRAVISMKDNNLKISLFKDEFNYDDELEYIKVAELSPDESFDDHEFAMGCYEIHLYKQDYEKELEFIEQRIRESEEKIEELKHSKWNEDNAIRFYKEKIEYLKEEKEKLQNAEKVEELVIDYSMGKLQYFLNGEWKDIDMEEKDSEELLFKNLEVKIEKF
jgi:TolA-binding protein